MFRFVSALTLVILSGSPGVAAQLTLQEISDYLNGIRTASARFEQINADGSRSQGQLFIRRPGRMRFEYDAPDKSIVIAGGGLVAIFDARSNQKAQQFQLANTPLKLLLFEDIDLRQERLVIGTSYQNGETTVVTQDPKHPEYGSLHLRFRDTPELTGWSVIDGGGSRTTVFLVGFETEVRLRNNLFNVRDEIEARER